MNYNGNTDEDASARTALYKLTSEDDLDEVQALIAEYYFKWGWEAAMRFVKGNKS